MKPFREFWLVHPEAEAPLRAWYRVVRKAEWSSFAELRAVYPHADRVGRFTVFNIGGNKYRLIAVIHYNRAKVYVRRVLTHAEYEPGWWKSD